MPSVPKLKQQKQQPPPPPPPPSKRRKKAANSQAVPEWETTRFFQQPKEKPSSLPTIQDNGVVRRTPNASKPARPKFLLNVPDFNANNHNKNPQPTSSKLPTPAPAPPPPPSFPNPKARARLPLPSYAQRLQTIESAKGRIASLASAITSDPQHNVVNLRHLRQMAVQHKGRIASLVLLTESQLYKDLAPAYRIRPISEKEAEVTVSKQVAHLRTFEQALLSGYQRFTRSCISLSRWRAAGNTTTPAAKDMTEVRRAACKSLAEMLRALPHFNDADVLVPTVCTLAGDRDELIRTACCHALTDLLSNAHKADGHTLATCVAIAKHLSSTAATKARVMYEQVVTPLSEIHFAGFAKLPASQKAPNERKKSKHLNRRQRNKAAKKDEHAPDENALERDLAEGNADASQQQMYLARKSLLDSVCHTCFNVVKAASADITEEECDASTASKKTRLKPRTRKPPPALSAALRGLLRVSRYVHTDVVDAIIAALTPMLNASRYPLAIRLRCLSVAYAILGLHARARQTDADSFTADTRAMDSALYAALGDLYAPGCREAVDESCTFDALEAVVSAHTFRRVPAPRAAALARRLGVLAAGSSPTHTCAIGLLRAMQLLLDASLVSPIFVQRGHGRDSGGLGLVLGETGLLDEYRMRGDDPDIATAQRSAAWELSSLMHHFHPAVRDIATRCASGFCGSRLAKSTENVVLFAKGFVSKEGGFNPPPQAVVSGSVRKRKRWSGEVVGDGALAHVFGDEERCREFVDSDEDCGSLFEGCWSDAGGEVQ